MIIPFYILIGCLFVLWLERHHTAETDAKYGRAENWQWVLTIAIWPLIMLILAVMIYRVARKSGRL